MKMTLEQKDLVVQNLNLVNEVIYYRVKRNPCDPDHDLEDLQQIGRLGLCLAAQGYDGVRPFRAYAREVIWHQLLHHFKDLRRSPKTLSMENENAGGLSFSEFLPDNTNVAYEAENRMNREGLKALEERYQGTVRKGIQAMGLKLDGLSGSEIAKLYHVKPNHVSAWISRAQQRLLQDQTLLKLVS